MMFYRGWQLDEMSRKLLLSFYPPKYENVRGDHVTLDLSDDPMLAPKPYPIAVTGYVDSGFMEVLTVEVAGCALRPDRKFYHITWSYEEGHRSAEANDVLIAFEHQRLPGYIAVNGTPFSLKRRSN